MKEKRENKEKIDDYFFEDNVRRLFLYDLLRREHYLKSITLEELDCLVNSINTLVSNLNYDFKKGKKMIKVSDKDNWAGGSLFRNTFLHNVLDIPITCDGSEKDFKEMLENRWETQTKKEVLNNLK